MWGWGSLVSRERGGATLSNFMLFNSADACPVPSWPDTDTHCHRWKLREGFVCSRKNSLTGEVSQQERKRKWARIHCFSVDGEAGRCLAPITIPRRIRCFQLISATLVLGAVPLANTGNHKLLGCLAGLKWEYRNELQLIAITKLLGISSRCQTMTENKSLRGRRQSWQQ